MVIQGDGFAVTPIHGGFATPTSVARIRHDSVGERGPTDILLRSFEEELIAFFALSNLPRPIESGEH